MCGICGVVNADARPVDMSLVRSMCAALVHRGPDSAGYYQADGIGLGHRRLSIIDLVTGDQPLHNENKTVWLAANGEIYNFPELRAELEAKGHGFASRSDTEVIVHLYEEYGEECLRRLRGMFAFALWDAPQRKLFVARDRLGKKPLVYWHDERRFVFASELQALVRAPFIRREVDPAALELYLTFLYVPAPRTMFKGVEKLLPGHYLVVRDGKVSVRRYWRLPAITPAGGSIRQYAQGLSGQLDEAVRLRLASDVPVGVFLSGGIDSSAVVAMMARHSPGAVKTFSVSFSHKRYNEQKFSRLVAGRFATDHHELLVTPQAVDILPMLIRHYGEPFGDYSCIPTYYLAKFAASKVKVVLTGDGGDESFAGYERYRACRVAEVLDRFPRGVPAGVYKLLSVLPGARDMRTRLWQLRRFFKSMGLAPLPRYLEWIAAFDRQEKAELLIPPSNAAAQRQSDEQFLSALYAQEPGRNFAEDTANVDKVSYLPNDLLVKMDIATMANSLEARSPFLDHVFMEYAAGIPFELKLRGTTNKYILKQSMSGVLPPEIIRRKKQGFGIPIGAWFRGELYPLLREMVDDAHSPLRTYFQEGAVRRCVDAHMSGKTDNGHKLWALLVFALWHREFID
ncbi:MAG: asparagine synthase (glutamine-hydrolyzing) [Candidatus Omnitrophica bacterium]|nr:asparagine synthase (glutamine-hydrolyzing) [Candidatus Omnitrophota bacterium]